MATKKKDVVSQEAKVNQVETGVTQPQVTEDKKSKLVGYDLVLNPEQSGMYVDPINKFTLSFFENGNDRITVTDTMDLTAVKRAISFGILKVFKDKEDVTEKMGGPKDNKNWKMIPVVTGGIKPVTDGDTSLVALLNRNSQEDIIKNVRSLSNLNTLVRLKELEETGHNPSSHPRSSVVDAITEEIEKRSGITEPKEDTSKRETITMK